jgi:hypothetical protein
VARLSRIPPHFEGVSDHGDKHDLLIFPDFSYYYLGASTVLAPYRGIIRNLCARFWVLQRPPKSSFRSSHLSQLKHGTHAADLKLARALGHN